MYLPTLEAPSCTLVSFLALPLSLPPSPALRYKNPGMFRDIVKGYNNGGGLEVFKKGFYATKGWDPVTGLGTPDYPHILAAAMNAAHA